MLLPILTLAVPGLLLSTTGIAAVVWLATPLSFRTALLLGAILSATDPVAVVSIFKRLGAPRRLHILVEGESLFNDATSLVVSRILATIIAGGALSGDVALPGVGEFARVFFGGVVAGAVPGFATAYVLRAVRSDSFVSITFTTILAYLSFIIAEEFLGVSGVMATVAAGLTFSGWGWMRVTYEVRTYLEYFWQYTAFVANALIFLLVGLLVDPASLLEAGPMLAWVIAGIVISRLAVSYALVPSLRLISRQYAFDLRSLGEERGRYIELFDAGHMSESALRTLELEMSLQLDAVRHATSIEDLHLGRFHKTPLLERLQHSLERLPVLRAAAERNRRRRFGVHYQLSWAHYQSSTYVLERR